MTGENLEGLRIRLWIASARRARIKTSRIRPNAACAGVLFLALLGTRTLEEVVDKWVAL